MAKRITNSEKCRFTGRAGELQIASQLLLRKFGCSFPEVDVGFDVHGQNGCRIQVKSARLSQSKASKEAYNEPVYLFHFQRDKAIVSGVKNCRMRPKKMFIDHCDVVVFWGIDHNRFWIVPAAVVGGIQIVALGPSNARSYAGDIKEMREMQSLGFSTYDIGKYYGISQAQAHRRLKADDEKATTTSAAIRACENAWENILDFGSKQDKVISEEVNGEQLEQTANLAGYGQQLP